MKTRDILWRRLEGQATSEHYSQWAYQLMEAGIESPEIIDLAANPQLHWHDQEPLVSVVLRQLGLNADDSPRMQAFQLIELFLADWRAGLLNDQEMADVGRKLFYRSEHAAELVFWVNLDSDMGMMEDGYPPAFFPSQWDPSDLTRSFRAIVESRWTPPITTPPVP